MFFSIIKYFIILSNTIFIKFYIISFEYSIVNSHMENIQYKINLILAKINYIEANSTLSFINQRNLQFFIFTN